MKQRGADLLVSCLVRQGVKHLFGMPGSHSTTVYDALDRDGRIGTTLIRNEQAGAFAADGYARLSGHPGVICTTAGPGATNALSGIAEAWADSVPVLLLAGQVNSDRMHLETGAYHEIDLESIFRPVTKWCGTVRSVSDIPYLVAQAFAAMCVGRPRPAALFLPQDLMALEVEELALDQADKASTPAGPIALPIAPKEIALAAKLLSLAQRPIVLAGGGALWAGAAAEVRAVAERLGAPVITSLNGKGIVDERDPISLGHARSARAKAALPHADAMLAIGCRFTEVMTGWRKMPVPERLVQIDLAADQIGMNHPVAVGIVADVKVALNWLLQSLPAAPQSDWEAFLTAAHSAREPHPEWLIETLRAELTDDVPVFADACEMGYRLQTDWPAYRERTCFYPSNYIALGWGFPAALGAAVARGGRPVVSLSGDGGFLMTSQELATAVRYRLHVIVVVHNDSAYGAIKNIQLRKHASQFVDVDLNNPDLLAFAASFGVPACRALDAVTFAASLRRALAEPGPSLIEVPDHWRQLRV